MVVAVKSMEDFGPGYPSNESNRLSQDQTSMSLPMSASPVPFFYPNSGLNGHVYQVSPSSSSLSSCYSSGSSNNSHLLVTSSTASGVTNHIPLVRQVMMPSLPENGISLQHQAPAPSDPAKRRPRSEESPVGHQPHDPPPPADWTTTAVAVPEPTGKKSRGNAYIPPRTIPVSVTSCLGSLAVAQPAGRAMAAGWPQVALRRQLSGSKLEAFLGKGNNNHHDGTTGDDSMEVDSSDAARPRSMSF